MTGIEKQALLLSVQMMTELFWGPTRKQCDVLLLTSQWDPVETMLPVLDSSAIQAVESIKAFLDSSANCQTLYESLEEEYVRFFINDRQGIRTPLYASCYAEPDSAERTPLMGESALAMQRRFQSKGLSLAEDVGEPPDHLAIELEYLYFLLDKGWDDNDDRLITEASSFAAGVMIPWLVKLDQGITINEPPGRFYPSLVSLLISLLQFIGKIESGI